MPRKPNLVPTGPRFIPSGCTLLDRVLGGGWAEGRIANIVGDESAGKTLLAIEACAQYAKLVGAASIAYREAESAFDQTYAQSLGLPNGIDYNEDIRTIEQFGADLVAWLDAATGPTLYILDSLDALSSDAEMDRDPGDPSYGTEKAKALSELFRTKNSLMHTKKCTVVIISQLRDNIGVRFGPTKKRSGGRALNYYASQVIWLSVIKKITRQATKVERPVGVMVRASNKKNKVGTPFCETDFTLLFNYGVDDEVSMLDWLTKNNGMDLLPQTNYARAIVTARDNRDRDAMARINAELKAAVNARWDEINDALAPPLSKYGA